MSRLSDLEYLNILILGENQVFLDICLARLQVWNVLG